MKRQLAQSESDFLYLFPYTNKYLQTAKQANLISWKFLKTPPHVKVLATEVDSRWLLKKAKLQQGYPVLTTHATPEGWGLIKQNSF